MTLLEVATIAKRYDTEIAHAVLHAVATAVSEGRDPDSPVGVPKGWGFDEEPVKDK